MMRSIKYKIYYRESPKHNYACWEVKELHFTKDGIEAYIDGDDSPYYVGDDSILVQFTGLLDKQGKEIYEGDIVIVQWQHVRDNLKKGEKRMSFFESLIIYIFFLMIFGFIFVGLYYFLHII